MNFWKTTCVIFVSSLVLFNGCKKKSELSDDKKGNDNQSNLARLDVVNLSEELADFYSAEADGHFMIELLCESPNTYSATNLRMNMNGALLDRTSSLEKIAFGNLVIDEFVVPCNVNHSEYSMFSETDITGGQMNTIKLYDASNSTVEFETDLYFPLPFDNQSIDVPSEISAGTTITWNSDPNNGKGILIKLTGNMNLTNTEIEFEDKIKRLIYVHDDNGSYTLTSQDLTGFKKSPSLFNGCVVSLIRGDYDMVFHSSNQSWNSKIMQTTSSTNFSTEVK